MRIYPYGVYTGDMADGIAGRFAMSAAGIIVVVGAVAALAGLWVIHWPGLPVPKSQRDPVPVHAGPCGGSGSHPRGWPCQSAGSAAPGAGAAGSRSRLSASALSATMRLDPDMDRAAISGRSTRPNAGAKTPAAMGSAMVL